MKGRIWDRLLLVCLALLCMGVGVLCIALALRIADASALAAFIGALASNLLYDLLFVALGLALVVLALYVLYAFFIKRHKAFAKKPFVIRQGEYGSLEISAEALETIVRQYCAQRPAVAGCEGDITGGTGPEGNRLRLSLSFAADANIAQELSQIQQELCEHLAATCGMQVTGVDITVVPRNEQAEMRAK